MRISQTVTIQREPAVVFRWIENPDLARQWQPEVVDYEITRASPGTVGTEFRELLRGSRGSMWVSGRVTGYVRGKWMEFDLTGTGVHVRATYALRPSGSGTELRVEIDVTLGNWWPALLQPVIRRKMANRMSSELTRLRQICESSAGQET